MIFVITYDDDDDDGDDDGELDFNFMTILVRLDDTRMIRTQMIENVWKEYKCFFFVYIWN